MLDWDFNEPTHLSPNGLPTLGLAAAEGDLGDERGQVGASGPSSGTSTAVNEPLYGPTSTLVGAQGGLQIDLIWDASVRQASNWSAIEAAVTAAAQIYTNAFANPITLNIDVGFGEIAGQKVPHGDTGESESNGYITNYSTVATDLAVEDAALVNSGQVAPGAITADAAALLNAKFFVTSAEDKALGLLAGNSTEIDGYIGLGSSLYFPSNGGTIGATQYDAVGVAAHELSEVMGRIGNEGASLAGSRDVYTPLDLFRYLSPGDADLKPTAGYFSADQGATNQGAYNDPSNGGDGSDWAMSSMPTDAYNAFGTPGVTTAVSANDLLEDAVLGYRLNPGETLAAVQA